TDRRQRLDEEFPPTYKKNYRRADGVQFGEGRHCGGPEEPVMSGFVIGVGLVGCGMIGHGHAYALRLLAEDGLIRPVAAADLSTEAIEAARSICPFERVGTDARAVINDPEVEAVAIVTPTTTHRDFVLATLDAQKPMLCEKPLATSIDVVREMCD